MPLFGNIVVIKRNGTDGISFPLTASSCLFGRRTECDIRIQLPQVSKEHCKIEVNENKEAILTNLSTVNPTQLNGGCFQQPVPLKHGDVLTIIDRSFRFEYPLQATPRKRRSRSPKDETLQEMSRDTGKRSHLQDHKELGTAGGSKGTEVTTKPSKENDGNAAFSLKPCSIECLDYADETKIYSSAIAVDKLAQTTNTTNVSEVDKYVLCTPTPRRKSPRSQFVSPTKETSGMNPVNTDTPTTRRRVSLKCKSLSEVSAETQREDSACRNGSPKQLSLAENECLKQRRNSKQHTPGKPVKEEVLKEIGDQANFVNSKEGHSETPASLSNSKSPRRNNRQSTELSNKSVLSETLASEELTSDLASPAGQKSDSGRKRGRPRTSGLLTENALETNAVQEHHGKTRDRKDSGTNEELATEGDHQKQELEGASVTRPRRLSLKRRSSGSAAVLKDDEAVSEMHISGLLAGEESGKTKRISQKKKSGDLLLQPLRKRKRVSFGGHLSPELFDKSLPPNSPLKRGAIPARLSLPFGNSPRAVLKKAQGLKHFAVQELSEHLQKEKMSPKNLPTQKSPAASSPASGKAAPKFTLGSPAPYTKGRFSVSLITTSLPIAEEKDTVAEDINTKQKNGARVKTPKSPHVNRDFAKSWAEVVKLGVARPQSKTVKKKRKIKGHFSTGHAESPATIVVGRAYSTTVRTAGQVPKVVKNPILKLNMNMDESFTGMTEMFQTPENKSGKALPLATVEKTDFTPTCTAVEISELHTPEESGEMMVSPLNSSAASEQKQDSPGICHLLREKESLKSMFDAISTKTPEKRKTVLEENISVDSLSRIPEKQASRVESGSKRRTPKQKLEPAEVMSGIKQKKIERSRKTPVQKGEAVKDVAGVTLIKKAPKLKYQPVEDMIGVSRIFKTPKEKVEPIEDTFGVSRLVKTPREKYQPVDDAFGISRLVKTPREKYQPVDDFVGLQRLMAEPRQKCSDSEVDYVGVTEMFDIPEEIKVRSVNVMGSKQEDTAPLCANSSHKYEDKGSISQDEDSQQKESTSEDQSTQRPARGRSQKTVHPASAKQCEKDLNLKELQGLGKKSAQEEMGEISTSSSVAKNEGRGRRTKRCMQEEIVSEHPDQEKVETVSFVEPRAATPRPGRGKRKEPKELKHPSENLESCGRDPSVLRKELANMKQTLQEYGINDILETEDVPTIKRVSVSSSMQNENCQLQTGLKKPENKSNEGGVEDSEEMLLSPGKRSRGVKKVENTEPLIPPKRGRRARNDRVTQASSEDLHGTTRKLRKDSSAKMIQRDEQTSGKDTETATAEESENGTKLEIKTTEKGIKSLRSARKHSAEIKADIGGIARENIQNIQKTEETSAETDTETQSHTKNEIKEFQGDETENAQENTTEASQRLKAESLSGEANKIPVTALNLEANRSAVRETNRTRNRRGKNDSLEKKTDELAKDVTNLELITPKFKSETEMDESSLKNSLSSLCVKNTCQVTEDQNNPAGASVPAANSDSLAHSRQKWTRNEQGIFKPKQTEILQKNRAQDNGTARRRGRGRQVNFELEEASSKVVGGKRSLPEDGKGMTYEDGQRETSENPSSQVRRSRRKQADCMPQIACSTFMEKQTLIADHSKDEAFVKEQDSALEATPSSTEDNPLRRGKRREVAAASQASRSISIRKRRGLLEGDDKKMTVKEDQNPALGNKTLQAKANASARDKRKKIDLAAEAKSSSSLWRKRGLSETDDKEESTNEEQNMPLETVSCVKEKPLGRGRRKETAPASRTTNYISLRGRRGLPADNGREEAPKEDQSVPLETFDSPVKENQVRKGRRKGIAPLLEATRSTSLQGKQGLSKESGRKNNYGEAKKLILENSTSQGEMDLSKGNSRQTVTSLAVSSTSLQGLPEDSKNKTPEEQQSILLEVAPSAKENPSRVGRKKTISSKSEATSSTLIKEEPGLPKDRRQKRILKEGEDTSLENNSSQEKTRQLRNKRKKVEFTSEAATSSCKNGDLPENGKTSETQNVCLTSAGSEKNNKSGKGKEVNPVQQATSTSRRRKCQLPADDLASKKLKSENDENRSLQKGRINKAKEELGEEDVRVTRTAGGTDRKTRSSTRTKLQLTWSSSFVWFGDRLEISVRSGRRLTPGGLTSSEQRARASAPVSRRQTAGTLSACHGVPSVPGVTCQLRDLGEIRRKKVQWVTAVWHQKDVVELFPGPYGKCYGCQSPRGRREKSSKQMLLRRCNAHKCIFGS
ncbi:PREDICTED: antigen KI-67 [Nipponia nippon]|nr:PREDICTED: antigen KI-67 [Nipponia nippon]